MTTEQRASANHTGLPDGVSERLAQFAAWTGATPPASVAEDQGDGLTFSTELLQFADRTGLSLDWLWLGTPRSLILGAYNRAQEGRA
ncbi:hypothetical protein [Vannielia sp. SX4]|uniref:hypothetical protein n=1 Tax=Vannielia sp. SX4 TaxID=3463852 RepID=UPI004059C185